MKSEKPLDTQYLNIAEKAYVAINRLIKMNSPNQIKENESAMEPYLAAEYEVLKDAPLMYLAQLMEFRAGNRTLSDRDDPKCDNISYKGINGEGLIVISACKNHKRLGYVYVSGPEPTAILPVGYSISTKFNWKTLSFNQELNDYNCSIEWAREWLEKFKTGGIGSRYQDYVEKQITDALAEISGRTGK